MKIDPAIMAIPGDRARAVASRFWFKLVAVTLFISAMPLVASLLLIDQLIRVSDSVAEGQLRRLSGPLSSAAEGYRELFRARKQVFQLQAELIARELAQSASADAGASAENLRLGDYLSRYPQLARVLLEQGGVTVARAARAERLDDGAHRRLRIRRSLRPSRGPSGAPLQLELVFITPRRAFEDFRALGSAQRVVSDIAGLRPELAVHYRVAFMIMFGGALVLATVFGLQFARRTVKRVGVLVAATRRVAAGDLETQVLLPGKDELGELGVAFNEMVRQLRQSRERISYLEKIGAWQEVARRLAHQIKNPLTPIQLMVQQLDRKYGGDDPRFRLLLDEARDIITEEVAGLRRLVEAFSAFAKLPAAQAEPVDLAVVVDDFLKSYVELAARANLRWEPPRDRWMVRVDRMLFKHVLYNLVENAVQAAEAVGLARHLEVAITVGAAETPGLAVIRISDNGPGIDRAIIDRVFDPYVTTKDHGTGLGLAIVKKIVLEHGGNIAVRSWRAEGASFEIVLPLLPQDALHGVLLARTTAR